MGTANFYTMEDFPLYVIDPEETDFDFLFEELETEADRKNEDLLFHKISIRSGYYTGMQLFVETVGEIPEDCDNNECRYNWNMFRSVAIRKYETEQRKIRRWMKQTAQYYNMTCLEVSGRFSSGETLYRRCLV